MPADPTDAIEGFIEGLGLSVQQDGLPRIAGRMLALFIVHGGPFSFSELAERLQVSRGSVSTNARILRQLGFIERLAMPGDRQDYYRLSDEPYARLLEGYVERVRARIALVEGLRAALPPAQRDARQRLGRMRDFYSAALAATEALMQQYREASADALP